MSLISRRTRSAGRKPASSGHSCAAFLPGQAPGKSLGNYHRIRHNGECDEVGATTEATTVENTVHTDLSSTGQDRPSAAFPQSALCPTGLRVPT
jgi:hypothetical protein